MAYTQQVWHDLPQADTPLSATRLGHLESGVGGAAETADAATAALVGKVAKAGDTLTGDLTAPRFLTSTGFALPLTLPRYRLPSYRQASTIQNFQAGHGWIVGGGGSATSNANDATTCIRGTQAVTVTTTGTGVQSQVRRLGLSAMDLTGKAIRLTFRVDDVTHLNRIEFLVGTGTFTNYFRWTVHTHSATPPNLVQSGEWCTTTLQWSDVQTAGGTYAFSAGAPSTKTGFTDLQINVYDDSGGAVTYHLQSVEFINDTTAQFPNGVVSVTFDDSWQSFYDLARPTMDSYGYRGTLYTIADVIGTTNKLTLPELRIMQYNSGWDVAGHAYSSANHGQVNGFASLTAAQTNDDFRNLKLWLNANGFTGDTFAYPKGHFGVTTDNVPIDQIAAQYWSASRTIISEQHESHGPPTPQRIRALTGINDGTGLGGTTVTALTATNGPLDRCRNSGSWLILCFHEITSITPTNSTQCSQTGFNTVMSTINSKGIPVYPISEVLRYFA